MTTRITPGLGANLIGQHAQERNQDATAYVGNLDPQATEDLLWELFTQAGPVSNVYVPKDRVSNLHQGFGFVEFRSEEDADYAVKIMNMIKLFGKPIRVNKASQDRRSSEIGANLFIGNLDPDVDEKLLYDTFSAFGIIANNPKIMRDPETGNSKGFGFVSYSSFEGSDAAIEAMNGQYLCNRAITVQYAYKKDSRGERHGTPAERLLAANNPSNSKFRPHTMFSSGPSGTPQPPAAPGGMPPPPGPSPAAPIPPPVPPGQPPAPPSGFGGPPPPPSGFGQGPPPPPRPPMGYQPQAGPYGAQAGGQMPMQMPFRPPPPPGAGGYAQGGPPRPPQGGPPPPWAQQQYPPPPGGNMPQPAPGQPGMPRPPWMTGPPGGGGMPGGMAGGRGPPPPPGQPGGMPPWGMGGPPPPPPSGYMGQPPPPQ